MLQVMTGQKINSIFVEVDFNESSLIQLSLGQSVSKYICSRFGLVLTVENEGDKSQFTKEDLLSASTSIPIEYPMSFPLIISGN